MSKSDNHNFLKNSRKTRKLGINQREKSLAELIGQDAKAI